MSVLYLYGHILLGMVEDFASFKYGRRRLGNIPGVNRG